MLGYAVKIVHLTKLNSPTRVVLIAGYDLTFKYTIDHQNESTANVECGWEYYDFAKNKTVNIMKIHPFNKSIQFNQLDFRNINFSMNETANFTRYSMTLLNVQPDTNLSRISFNHSKNAKNNKHFIITVIEKEFHYSINNRILSSKSAPEAVIIVNIENSPHKVTSLVNQILIGPTNSVDNRTLMNVFSENRNDINKTLTRAYTSHGVFIKKINNSGGYTEMFTFEWNFTRPGNSSIAWAFNNHEIKFKLNEEFWHTREISLKHSSDSILVFNSNPIFHKQFVCKFIFRVEFKPFILPSHREEQVFPDSSPAFIKCPIQAYQYFNPPKYYIVWYLNSTLSGEWLFRQRKEFLSTDEFYVLDNPSFEMYNNSVFKCELVEIEPLHYHPSYSQHDELDQFSKHHTNVILSASIRLKIVTERNQNPVLLISFFVLLVFVIFVVLGLLVCYRNLIGSRPRAETFRFKMIKTVRELEIRDAERRVCNKYQAIFYFDFISNIYKFLFVQERIP
jgi:hypothetical protein